MRILLIYLLITGCAVAALGGETPISNALGIFPNNRLRLGATLDEVRKIFPKAEPVGIVRSADPESGATRFHGYENGILYLFRFEKHKLAGVTASWPSEDLEQRKNRAVNMQTALKTLAGPPTTFDAGRMHIREKEPTKQRVEVYDIGATGTMQALLTASSREVSLTVIDSMQLTATDFFTPFDQLLQEIKNRKVQSAPPSSPPPSPVIDLLSQSGPMPSLRQGDSTHAIQHASPQQVEPALLPTPHVKQNHGANKLVMNVPLTVESNRAWIIWIIVVLLALGIGWLLGRKQKP